MAAIQFTKNDVFKEKCKYCEKVFEKAYDLIVHISKAHPGFWKKGDPIHASGGASISTPFIYDINGVKKEFSGGDKEPEYAIKTVEPIFGGMEGDKQIGHKVLYVEDSKWDADLYNYGSKGPQGAEPYWRGKNGSCIKLIDLELTHLRNIIKLVMRKDANYITRLIFAQLLLEQKRREDSGELW